MFDCMQQSSYLRELYAILEYSLANYAAQTSLYVGDGQQQYLTAIREIAKQRTGRAAEVGRLLAKRRVFMRRRGFPMHFTGLNDLSVLHVARQILDRQPGLIAGVGQCASALKGDQEGHVLARQSYVAEVENLRQFDRLFGEQPDVESSFRIAA